MQKGKVKFFFDDPNHHFCMEPKHLQQLALILDKGSVTAAAQHFNLSQPTLTRNMATLEMQAGQPLFQRSRFGVRSTPLGEQLARIGRAISRQMVQANDLIARDQLGMHTSLRIGAGPLIGLAIMTALSSRLMARMPALALSITTVRPLMLVEQLLDQDLDVVIAPPVYEHVPPGLTRELLVEDRVGVYCSPSHPMARLAKPTAQDFAHCDWINVGITSPFHHTDQDYLSSNGIFRTKTQLVTLGDAVILLELLMQGKHLAVLPNFPIAQTLGRYPLVRLDLPNPPKPRNLYMWSHQDRQDEPGFQLFREEVFALLQSLSPTPPTAKAGARRNRQTTRT
jgi:DNA-binding transcriptional LysR family regulator